MTAYSVFVDTNVLVYQTFEDFEPDKHAIVTSTLQQLHERQATLYISPQVIREFVAIATNEKIFKSPLQPEQAVLKVTEFRKNFQMIVETEVSLNLLQQFIAQQQITKYRVHDANLAATAIAHHLDYFWTFNTKDFARFEGLTLLTVPLPVEMFEG